MPANQKIIQLRELLAARGLAITARVEARLLAGWPALDLIADEQPTNGTASRCMSDSAFAAGASRASLLASIASRLEESKIWDHLVGDAGLLENVSHFAVAHP